VAPEVALEPAGCDRWRRRATRRRCTWRAAAAWRRCSTRAAAAAASRPWQLQQRRLLDLGSCSRCTAAAAAGRRSGPGVAASGGEGEQPGEGQDDGAVLGVGALDSFLQLSGAGLHPAGRQRAGTGRLRALRPGGAADAVAGAPAGRGGCRQMQHAAAARATTNSPGPRLLSSPHTASRRPPTRIAAMRGCAGATGDDTLAPPLHWAHRFPGSSASFASAVCVES
jgi:hypothetical protein